MPVNKKTITLKRPIKRGEKVIKEVTVSEPKDAGVARGLKLLDLMQLDANALFVFLPRVTEPKLTQPEVENLTLSDLASLGGAAINFLAD